MSVVVALTNKVPVATIRGAGYPQGAFTMERMLDLVAVRLGLDRAEVRSRNLIPASKMPYTKPLRERSGATIVYDGGDYPATQAQALEAADWQTFRARQAEALAAGRYIGIGIANMVKGSGRGPFESGTVRVSASGQVNVFTGAVAMGQGLATALAQIVSDELGVAPDQVRVTAGDTASSPLGLGGFASRQLVTAGSSVHLAAKSVANKARRLASDLLEVAEDRLEQQRVAWPIGADAARRAGDHVSGRHRAGTLRHDPLAYRGPHVCERHPRRRSRSRRRPVPGQPPAIRSRSRLGQDRQSDDRQRTGHRRDRARHRQRTLRAHGIR
jgi:carbon-monoxide dehydrogenase large subunit